MPENAKKQPLFDVYVFGVVVGKNDAGEPAVLVNVPAKQAKLKALSERLPDWPGLIVGLPGGQWEPTDKSEGECLRRLVQLQTQCEATIVNGVLGVYPRVNLEKPSYEITLGYLVELNGEPQLTHDITEHCWVTPADLESKTSETPLRFLGGSGRSGRQFQLALRGLERHQKNARRQQASQSGILTTR